MPLAAPADLFDTIDGLPAHPLVVHASLGLVVVAGLGALVSLLPRWRPWALPASTVLGVVAAISTVVATESGESLERRLPHSQLIEEHAQAGENSRTIAIVLAVLLILWWLLDRLLRRAVATAARSDLSADGPVGDGSVDGPVRERPVAGARVAAPGAGGGSVAAVATDRRTSPGRRTALDRRAAPSALRAADAVLSVLVAVAAIASIVLLYVTGERGARAVWNGIPSAPSSQSQGQPHR